MYSQTEIDEAVAAGALTPEAATALRTHIQQQRHQPTADEEQFRLITGFNDIFVSIAAAILLFAVGFIGQWAGERTGLAIGHGPSFLGPLLIAITSWSLALFFTARRRMALPSILLLLAFMGSVLSASGMALVYALGPEAFDNSTPLAGIVGAVSAAIAAAAAWFHWKRFRVPITVATGAAAVAAIVVGLVFAALGDRLDNAQNFILSVVLLLGICTFLFAMWWDGSDRARLTRRADVAFWLHLLAAPMIVHPVFTLLGLNDGNATILEGLVVVLLYVVIGLTALAIDRRALLVSALAYVLYALNRLFEELGTVELNVALTALVIGSALLMLSAFWHQARAIVVKPLPTGLRDRLPLVDRAAPISQPAA
jgi:hypothetical protein